jgi:hypothetical protein
MSGAYSSIDGVIVINVGPRFVQLGMTLDLQTILQNNFLNLGHS